MQEKINDKLNYLDQYVVNLLLGQRLSDTVPLVPSIRGAAD